MHSSASSGEGELARVARGDVTCTVVGLADWKCRVDDVLRKPPWLSNWMWIGDCLGRDADVDLWMKEQCSRILGVSTTLQVIHPISPKAELKHNR